MSDILCQDCGHKAEEHDHRTACGWGSGREDDDCDCRLDPSDVYIANLDDMTTDCDALKAALAAVTAERDELKVAMWDVRDALERGESYYIIGNIIRAALEKVGKK